MKSDSMTRKASVLFSAIAASSFLGLPALAQVNSNPNSNMRGDCVPATQADRPGTSANANTSGVQEFPNQTDPRAGVNNEGMNNQANSSGGSAISSTTQSSAASTDNSSSVGSTSRSQNNDQTAMTNPGVGAAQPNNVLASGGATNGGDSRQITQEATNPSSEMQSSYSQRSGQSDRTDRTLRNQMAMTSPGVKAARYGDVLASGGATNGGESNRIFQAANDSSTPAPDYSASTQSNQSSAYQSSQSMTGSGANQANQGATSGGESQQNVESSATGTTSQTTSRSSSSTMNNQLASNQCPPGMVPSSQQNEGNSSQQSPAQPAEQRGSRGQ